MRRAGRWALGGIGAFAFLALVGGLRMGWDYDRVADELPQAVRDYRAAGLPWTAADLAIPKVPDARNAAEPIRAAGARLLTGRFDYKRGVDPASLSRDRPAFVLAHLAAARAHFDPRRDWDLGQTMPIPEPRTVRLLVSLLATRAEGRAERGDDAGALADLRDARRLAGLVGEDPTMLSALASAAGETTVMRATIDGLAARASTAGRIARYLAFLDEPPRLPDFRRALRSQAYLAVATARNLDRTGLGTGVSPGFEGLAQDLERRFGMKPPTPPPLLRDGLPEGDRQRAYLARGLQMWTGLARATHDLTDPFDQIQDRMGRVVNRPFGLVGMSHNLDAILFPTFWWLDGSNRSPRARRAVALAFADALLLRAKTGRWPTVIATPDPYGTGALRCRLDGKRFRVWSVGPDGKDGGGRTWTEARRAGGRSDDLVAAYPPIPR